ncbi:MAG TPA: alpha/beta hydrolase [Usitatibacter sp.]|jgi:haloacetate dehalogenase|nr:alpha/beta hydrolase [Usitatibacter sp.]
MTLFPGFREELIAVDGVDIRAVLGPKREAPALLLLHGYPQTHAIWHKIAPRLAARYNVVASDLRGYGDSGKPVTTDDHAPYSKRAMAADQVALMRALGHERFLLAGHDRGGRVGHRLAIDHAASVIKLAVLDIAPTLAMYEQTNEAFARAYWHWFFLILPAPIPERMIGRDLEGVLPAKMGSGRGGPQLVGASNLAPFAPEAWAEYVRCFTPGMVHASCEDYRAAASIDLVHDRADREAGRKVRCPLLVLWGARGVVEKCFRPLDEWRRVADDVRGRSLPAGHYLPEEVPELVSQELEEFFG